MTEAGRGVAWKSWDSWRNKIGRVFLLRYHYSENMKRLVIYEAAGGKYARCDYLRVLRSCKKRKQYPEIKRLGEYSPLIILCFLLWQF